MKISYYEDTNMAQAAAELSAFPIESRRLSSGSQPPFIIRFDASSLPVGQLVLSSATVPIMNYRIWRTCMYGLRLRPFRDYCRRRHLEEAENRRGKCGSRFTAFTQFNPDQIVEAIRLNNQTAPSGNVRVGDKNYITPTNNTIKEIRDFEKIPLFKGGVQNLYLGDVATVKDGADITAGYAL
jgi:multidrug efflux pump subunit AcrB